jgi:LmbE family N-acetylglucosaminyl deacetylase
MAKYGRQAEKSPEPQLIRQAKKDSNMKNTVSSSIQSRLTRSAFMLAGVALSASFLAAGAAPIREAPENPSPDERFKTDILVIVAHPDDETEITGYLARAIFDEHKRVAAIFGTPGNGGGDAVSNAQAAALGDIRAIEAREALATFGVMHVWFLGAPDTPGQDVLRSLETWNHGNALWETVRLIRLTRPEVILTWLPDYVAGENHDDHQAAGVIATEAFDLAGNPTVFPEQVSAPRNRDGVGNLTEGLLPWQPKKIYYFSDAANMDFAKGQGPSYSTTDESPGKHETYYKLAAEEMVHHLTQGDTGQMAKQALATNDFTYFKVPVQFIFGKSLVGGSSTGDIFEGIQPGAIPYKPVHGYHPESHSGVWIELGGPWAFYREFWKAHDLGHLADLIKIPEVAVGNDAPVKVPILIHNDMDELVEVTLTSSLSSGWRETAGTARYPVRPHEAYPVQALYVASSTAEPEIQTLTWKAESGGQAIGSLTLQVLTDTPGLPQ